MKELHSFLNHNLTLTSHNSDTSDRSRMIELLVEVFGQDSVAPISTYGQLQLKSLIKDLGRLYSVDFEDLNKRTALIEKEALAGARKNIPGFDRGVWVLTYEQAEEYSPTFNKLVEDFPEIDQHLKVLFKQIKSTGKHAGGVILSDNIPENMPLIKSGGALQTPWTDGVNFRHLEGFGFLKFDFLGVGTLRMLQEATKRVMIKEGSPNPSFKEIKEWYNSRLAPDNCEYDDQKVYENVFWNKNYAATFQYVSSDVQEFASQFKPSSLEDLSIITSIFRPGPLSAHVDKEVLEAKLHPENQKYKHPLLREVLGTTYSKIVYQEQLQLIYHKLGGVPLDETDYVRKAFTKKEISGKEKADAEKLRLKQEFIDLCKKNNNISEIVSTSVFADIEKMAAYSFNKSHSLSYMCTSYATAWFLTYYPDEWLAVYIDHCSGDKGTAVGKEDPKAVAIKEAKTLGYEIVYPDVNKTFYHCWAGDKKIYPGFRSVKYVSEAGTAEVIKGRPFTSMAQFLTDPETGLWKFTKVANKRTIETLIKIEAFPELVGPDKEFKNHKHLCSVIIGNFDKLKKAAAKKKLQEAINQFNMICTDLSDWTKHEKEEFKLKLAGINSFEIPDAFLLKAKEVGIPSIEEFEDKGMYWGVTEECSVATTKTGKLYLKLKIKGLNNKPRSMMLWGFDPNRTSVPVKNDIVIGTFEDSDFGLKGFASTLKIFKV